MKKIIILFIFIICCATITNSEILNEESPELTFQNLDGDLITVNFSDKNTIIIFWADY